jgi:RNA polymerase-binding transcription factor DksA
MRQTRLEWLADRRETLEAEIRNHESEARFHHRMAIQKQTALDTMTDEYYELCEKENAPIPVSALSTFDSSNLLTAIVADIRSTK